MTQNYASIKNYIYQNTKIARGKAHKKARLKNWKYSHIYSINSTL